MHGAKAQRAAQVQRATDALLWLRNFSRDHPGALAFSGTPLSEQVEPEPLPVFIYRMMDTVARLECGQRHLSLVSPACCAESTTFRRA